MQTEKMGITDQVGVAKLMGRPVDDKTRVRVNVHTLLTDEHGNVKVDEWGENLVTDAGDGFIANRMFDNAIDIVTGMKLGTGTTAAAKNGAGAAMVTYKTGSQEALDAAATAASKGAGLGERTTYVCTWAAGDVIDAALAEVCLTNQTALADNTSLEADTVARFVFTSTIDKQAGDQLVVTWNIDILGA